MNHDYMTAGLLCRRRRGSKHGDYSPSCGSSTWLSQDKPARPFLHSICHHMLLSCLRVSETCRPIIYPTQCRQPSYDPMCKQANETHGYSLPMVIIMPMIVIRIRITPMMLTQKTMIRAIVTVSFQKPALTSDLVISCPCCKTTSRELTAACFCYCWRFTTTTNASATATTIPAPDAAAC